LFPFSERGNFYSFYGGYVFTRIFSTLMFLVCLYSRQKLLNQEFRLVQGITLDSIYGLYASPICWANL